MPRVAELLDRESQSVDLEHGDFERLLRRRERRQRNRRLGAAAVALVVMLATTAVLLRSFASDPVPADPPEPSPMVLGSLAYVLDGDVYVADPDGSDAVKIADGRSADDCFGWSGEYWAEGPIWSPDGRYLAYRRYTGCSGSDDQHPLDVVISDAEGNVVATFPGLGWAISWSPDSTRVAVSVRGDGRIGIYGLDGVRQTVLTLPPGLKAPGDYDPVWSPDGTSLMIAHGVEIPLDGSTPRQLPSDDPRSLDAKYSPDGSRVVYTSDGALVVAAADGSDARQVVGRSVVNPVWSPAGDLIAFTYSEGPSRIATELRVFDVATGTVTSLAGMGGFYEIWAIEFSPEGDRILFSTLPASVGEGSLWSVDTDGSDLRRLVSGTYQGDWQALDPTG